MRIATPPSPVYDGVMNLRPCTRCRRHVVAADPTCPFCGAAVDRTSLSRRALGRISRAAVFASAVGCAKTAPPPAQPSPTEPRFAVPPANESASVRGVVTAGGVPVNGMRVTLEPLGASVRRSTRTDANGAYAFDDVPVGRYRVAPVTNERRPPPSADLDLTANARLEQNFQLPAAAPVDHHHEAKPYGAPPARRRVV